VVSAANQGFDAQLCCPQRMSGSLSNCVVRSESGVRCRVVLSLVNSMFAAELVLSAANQVFTAEFVWSAANQGFATEFMLSAVNHGFNVEWCCRHRIKCLLPNCVVSSE